MDNYYHYHQSEWSCDEENLNRSSAGLINRTVFEVDKGAITTEEKDGGIEYYARTIHGPDGF